MPVRCACPDANHRPGCHRARLDEQRAALYSGLYDVAAGAPPATRVRLLNPGHDGDDASGRRFSLLEID